MGVGIIAPATDACARNIRWKEVFEPVLAFDCPCLTTVSVKTMNGDYASKEEGLVDFTKRFNRSIRTQRQRP